jgi:hypothetical protein
MGWRSGSERVGTPVFIAGRCIATVKVAGTDYDQIKSNQDTTRTYGTCECDCKNPEIRRIMQSPTDLQERWKPKLVTLSHLTVIKRRKALTCAKEVPPV